MKREDFKAIAVEALEQLVSRAEQRTGRQFSRLFCFRGLIGDDQIDGDIAEYLVNMTFVDEDHIFPCFDLFLEEVLSDGRLLVRGYRAGYAPCAFGAHFTYETLGHDAGRVGPFKLGIGNFVDRNGK